MKYALILITLACAQITTSALSDHTWATKKCTPGKPCRIQQQCLMEPCPTVPGICSAEGDCTFPQ